jgi:hypothetical protein
METNNTPLQEKTYKAIQFNELGENQEFFIYYPLSKNKNSVIDKKFKRIPTQKVGTSYVNSLDMTLGLRIFTRYDKKVFIQL